MALSGQGGSLGPPGQLQGDNMSWQFKFHFYRDSIKAN